MNETKTSSNSSGSNWVTPATTTTTTTTGRGLRGHTSQEDKVHQTLQLVLLLLQQQQQQGPRGGSGSGSGSGIQGSVDMEPYLDQAFTLALSSRSNRSPAYLILIFYLKNEENPFHPRQNALIDKVSTLIESALPSHTTMTSGSSGNQEEWKYLPTLLFLLANDHRNDMKSHWTKNITKIGQTCLRLLTKLKSVFLSSVGIEEGGGGGGEKTEQWSLTWEQMLIEARSLLTYLPLPLPSVKLTASEKSIFDLELTNKKKDVRGVHRAIAYKDYFDKVCRLLCQLLQCGSAQGSVQVPLKGLLNLLSDLLIHFPKVDPTLQAVSINTTTTTVSVLYAERERGESYDKTVFKSDSSKLILFIMPIIKGLSYIENDKGLSAVDIALILPELKVSLLTVLETLLSAYSTSTSSRTLQRYATMILSPIMKTLYSLYIQDQMTGSNPIVKKIIQVFTIACPLFPVTLAELLTSYESLESSSSSTSTSSALKGKKKKSAFHNLIVFLLLEEMKIVTINPLSLSERSAAAKSSNTASSSSRGSGGSSTLGKRKLSTMETDNLHLPRKNNHEKVGEVAQEILLVLGHIFQPSRFILPAYPVEDILQKYLMEQNEKKALAYTMTTSSSTTGSGSSDLARGEDGEESKVSLGGFEDKESVMDVPVHEGDGEGKSMEALGFSATPLTTTTATTTTSSALPPSGQKKVSTSSSSSQKIKATGEKKAKTVVVAKKKDDDDDDDDMPELDMED
eukprot:scaffold281_cov282-Ochromonas_danica.AAC.5